MAQVETHASWPNWHQTRPNTVAQQDPADLLPCKPARPGELGPRPATPALAQAPASAALFFLSLTWPTTFRSVSFPAWSSMACHFFFLSPRQCHALQTNHFNVKIKPCQRDFIAVVTTYLAYFQDKEEGTRQGLRSFFSTRQFGLIKG